MSITLNTGKNLGDMKVRPFAERASSDKFKASFGKVLTPFGEYHLYHDAVVVLNSVNAPPSLSGGRSPGVSRPPALRLLQSGEALLEERLAPQAYYLAPCI